MKGLIIFVGGSFRTGGQHCNSIGKPESYDEQMNVCDNHIRFIEHIKSKYNTELSCYISTYNTQYTNDLLEKYKNHLIGHKIYNNFIGITSLFQNTINDVKKIENIDNFDFILYIRIDLYLKERFFEVFNPTLKTIQFPTICWYQCHSYRDEFGKLQPRINDNILFIPKKYYNCIEHIKICHELWGILINVSGLTYNDLDVMINTLHDSDSEKDLNPLYYIVNRRQTPIHNSPGRLFDKFKGYSGTR